MELKQQIALEIVIFILVVWPFVFIVTYGMGDAVYDKIDALEDSVGDRIKEYVVLVTSNFEYYFIDLTAIEYEGLIGFHPEVDIFTDMDGTSCLTEFIDVSGEWGKFRCPNTTKETDHRLEWEDNIVERYYKSDKRWEELEWLRPNLSVETVHNVYVPWEDWGDFWEEWREQRGCECICKGSGPYCRCICPTVHFVFVPYYNSLAYEMFWEVYKIEHNCHCEQYREDTPGAIYKCECPNDYEGTSEYGFRLMGSNQDDCLCKNWTVVKLPKNFVSSRTNNFLTQYYNCTFSFEAQTEVEPYDFYSCPKCETCSAMPETFQITIALCGNNDPDIEFFKESCMYAGGTFEYKNDKISCYDIPKNNL